MLFGLNHDFLERCLKISVLDKTMVNYKPESLALLTTNGCDANCEFCGIEKRNPAQRLSLETMHDYTDQARRYGIRNVSFTGGESFLLGEDLFDAISYAHNSGMFCGLVTNGSYAKDEETGKRTAKRLFDSGLDMLKISMDQSHLEFVPYEKSFNALKGALQYELSPNIVVTDLRSTNFRNWMLLRRIAKDLGGEFEDNFITVDGKKVACYHWSGAGRQGEAKKLDKREFKFRKIKYNEDCDAQTVTVRSDGKVAAPCCSFVSASKDFYVMGDANDTTIEEVVEKTNASVIGSVLIGPFGLGRIANVLTYSKDHDIRKLANKNYTSPCEFCGTVFSDEKATAFITKKFEKLKDSKPKVVFKEGYLATTELLARVVLDGEERKRRFVTFLGPVSNEDYGIARYSHDLEILEGMEKEQGEMSEYTDKLKMSIEILQQVKAKS